MDTPNINQIKAMNAEDIADLNRRSQRKLAVNIVGFIFLKLAIGSVTRSIATKAIIEAAKRV